MLALQFGDEARLKFPHVWNVLCAVWMQPPLLRAGNAVRAYLIEPAVRPRIRCF